MNREEEAIARVGVTLSMFCAFTAAFDIIRERLYDPRLSHYARRKLSTAFHYLHAREAEAGREFHAACNRLAFLRHAEYRHKRYRGVELGAPL